MKPEPSRLLLSTDPNARPYSVRKGRSTKVILNALKNYESTRWERELEWQRRSNEAWSVLATQMVGCEKI